MTTFFVSLLFGLAWQPPTLPSVSLDDLRMFPSREDAIRGTNATLRYRCEVNHKPPFGSQRECDLWHDWHVVAYADAYGRWFQWDDLLIATNPVNSDDYRLMALARLRTWLGPWNYAHGAMPSPVPWRWD